MVRWAGQTENETDHCFRVHRQTEFCTYDRAWQIRPFACFLCSERMVLRDASNDFLLLVWSYLPKAEDTIEMFSNTVDIDVSWACTQPTCSILPSTMLLSDCMLAASMQSDRSERNFEKLKWDISARVSPRHGVWDSLDAAKTHGQGAAQPGRWGLTKSTSTLTVVLDLSHASDLQHFCYLQFTAVCMCFFPPLAFLDAVLWHQRKRNAV